MFGIDRLQDVFFRSAYGSPDDVRDGILKKLEDFDLTDDVTIVVVKMD